MRSYYLNLTTETQREGVFDIYTPRLCVSVVRRNTLLLAFLFVSFASTALSEPRTAASGRSSFRGWDFLVTKLLRDHVSEDRVRSIYQNTRMPRFTTVSFKVKPKESKRIYAHFTKREKVQKAAAFLRKHRQSFMEAEQRFDVSPAVICAILLIETHLGTNTGKDLVINRLSRLANIADPNNLEHNYRELKKKGESVTRQAVIDRGNYLHEMFYPEVLAAMKIVQQENIDIFTFKGSKAGAFGFPQFLPSSYLKFAVDGNKDGVTSLYDEHDSIASIGNFLSSFGWNSGLSTSEQKKVIWRYNHSEAYVDAVLEVAKLLE